MRSISAAAAFAAIVALTGCTSKDAARTSGSSAGSDSASPEWPASTKSDDARKHLSDAEQFVDAGLIDDGYKNFKRVVAADSAFAFGYLRLAQNAYSLDEYKANLERAKALASTASPAEKLMIAAEDRAFVGDFPGAIDSARKAAALMPNNPRPYLMIGLFEINSGQSDSVRADMARMLAIAPDWGRAHIELAQASVFYEPRDFKKAEEQAAIALKVWPDKPYTHDNLGDIRRAQGRLKEAADAYTKVIELSPRDNQGYDQRGHANTFLGNFDQARADYESAIRVGQSQGNNPAINAEYRALVDAYAGHADSSLVKLQQLVDAIDGMGIPEPAGFKIGILKDLITVAGVVNDVKTAEHALAQLMPANTAFAATTGNPEIIRQSKADNAVWTGRVAMIKGDYSAAMAKADEYKKLRETDRDPGKLRIYYNLVGHVALAQKKYDEAQKDLAQSDPYNMEVQFARAQALEGLGRAADAKALYKTIAGYNFNDGPYASVRAKAVAKAQ